MIETMNSLYLEILCEYGFVADNAIVECLGILFQNVFNSLSTLLVFDIDLHQITTSERHGEPADGSLRCPCDRDP